MKRITAITLATGALMVGAASPAFAYSGPYWINGSVWAVSCGSNNCGISIYSYWSNITGVHYEKHDVIKTAPVYGCTGIGIPNGISINATGVKEKLMAKRHLMADVSGAPDVYSGAYVNVQYGDPKTDNYVRCDVNP